MTDLPYWTLHEAPPDSPKKWAVRVPTSSGRGKVVLFGARGYEDFTTHHDVERRERYRTRHQRDRLDDPYAPGFWSMWALWGESDDLDTAFAAAVRNAKQLTEKTMARTPRKNPVHEQFNFSLYEGYASRLTDDQLHHAIIDALDTLKVARTWEDNGAGEAKYLDQLYVLRREQKARGKRSNPGPMREDWLKQAKKAGRQDAVNFGDSLGERRDYLEHTGWRDLDPEDRQALLQAWDEGAFGGRSNPSHFEQYEFRVSNSFLPALFNGDTSGLSPEDEVALDRFMRRVTKLGHGHWAVIEEDAGFGRDEITGLGSDRALVAWMASSSRQNPDWAKTVGRHLYTGTRYAAESARDLYRGAVDEHRTRKPRPS